MKPTDLFAGIIHFFNDLIGAVVPGIILITGLFALKCYPSSLIDRFLNFDESLKWLIFLVISYVLGHGLLSIHRVLQTFVGSSLRGINSLLKKKKWDMRKNEDLIASSNTYKRFLRVVSKRINSELEINEKYELDFNDLRSMAMTISTEGGELARRFMFISLFCYGVSMSVLILGFIDLIRDFSITKFAAYLGVFIVFYIRGVDFELRAQNTPFSIALANILFEKVKNEDEE